MQSSEIKALLPEGKYMDLDVLFQDIRRALLNKFPDCEKMERTSKAFEMKLGDRPLEAVVAFRPTEDGKVYYINIFSGVVEKVACVGYSAE